MENTVVELPTHAVLAPWTNGETWKLLEKEDRTPDETELMIHTAHASCYHWHFAGTPLHQQRGEWLLAHVYTVAGRLEPALHHAARCLSLTEKHADLMADFDHAYAFEGMARAHALARQVAEARHYYIQASLAGEKIADEEDRTIFTSDFAAGPWFDLV